MITIDVFYPQDENDNFDLVYYRGVHLKMVQELLGPECKKITVEKGVAGIAPNPLPTYTIVTHLHFETAEAFQAAFSPHAGTILADIAKFTTVTPVIQISERLI